MPRRSHHVRTEESTDEHDGTRRSTAVLPKSRVMIALKMRTVYADIARRLGHADGAAKPASLSRIHDRLVNAVHPATYLIGAESASVTRSSSRSSAAPGFRTHGSQKRGRHTTPASSSDFLVSVAIRGSRSYSHYGL